MGEAGVAAEWNAAKGVGWHGASMLAVGVDWCGWDSQGEAEWNGGLGERNGMRTALPRGLPRWLSEPERKGTKVGGT
ncbi:MAG: hypothetical protein AB7U05_12905 [Mangrovibacterium sp.]